MFDKGSTLLFEFWSTYAVVTGMIVRVITEGPEIVELPMCERREEERRGVLAAKEFVS